MTTATTNRAATYKGRTYRLLYIGKTKFGNRAHLQFTDGSKDFWVAADLVTEGSTGVAQPTAYRRSSSRKSKFANSPAYDHQCYACRRAREDGKEACEQCLFDEYDC